MSDIGRDAQLTKRGVEALGGLDQEELILEGRVGAYFAITETGAPYIVFAIFDEENQPLISYGGVYANPGVPVIFGTPGDDKETVRVRLTLTGEVEV